ncbi:MAG: histidine phosphatase family protein [Calditrichia bacterium]
MSLFYLIRHGETATVGKTVAGRSPGVHLTEKGRKQAEGLIARLSDVQINQIFCSPMERTRDTAAPLAEKLGLKVNLREELNEIDFGHWTGKSLDELHGKEAWQLYNQFRSGFRIPGGELLSEVQGRTVRFFDEIRREYRDQTIAVFSHKDTLRALLCYFLGMPLDFILRFEISPASISILSLKDYGPELLLLNSTDSLQIQ